MTESPYSVLKGLGDFKRYQRLPVEQWHPETIRDLDIRIDRGARWYHEGGIIKRAPMVRLFSSLLRREGDSYFLVTPVEKCRITVEDVPFEAILLQEQGSGLERVICFTTNVGDEVTLGPEHPLRIELDPLTDEPSPYILVRDGLEARLARSVYYQLVELAQVDTVDGEPWWGVWSSGVFFRLAHAEETDSPVT